MRKTQVIIAQPAREVCCQQGGLHSGQHLSLVCLESRCRQAPLACNVCYALSHKSHSVVPLSKFIDEYCTANSEIQVTAILQHFLAKEQSQLISHFASFRQQLEAQLNEFSSYLQTFTDPLRDECLSSVGKQSNAQLHTCCSPSQLAGEVHRIFRQTTFSGDMHQVGRSQLRQKQDLIRTYLDQFVNSTAKCTQDVLNAAAPLLAISTHLSIAVKDLSFSSVQNSQSKPSLVQTASPPLPLSHSIPLQFGLNHHECLRVHKRHACSNITALTPQYALLHPHLETEPLSITTWSLKIKNCRDFATKSTMGIGVTELEGMKQRGYEGGPQGTLLLTSQGYLVGHKEEECRLVFGAGDRVHCKYDPFYETLQISKDNGRKIVVSTRGMKKPLYGCVRFTYASDSVSIL